MKPYPFLDANIEALKRQNAPIYHWLAAQELGPQSGGGNIIMNRRGLVDWCLPSGQGLFDGISPETAYRSWAFREEETSVSVIIGCNMGYGLNHILSNTPDTHKLMVLEPRADMLLACLGHTDYRPFIEKKRLIFIPPARESLEKAMHQLILPCLFGKVYLRTDLPSHQLGPEYAKWTETCLEFLEDLRVELHTVRLRQDTMIRNELSNFQRAMREGSLMTLKGQGCGISAVILGAGPSLEQFAPLLAENPGRALYTTSLQALPGLRRHGLKPHLCMAIECHESFVQVYDHFDMEWCRDIPLIYSTTISPEVVKAYPGPTVPLWTLGGLASHILQGQELVLDVAGNVGVALIRFMAWCGVNQLLLVGQDFAWSGGQTHMGGHLAAGSAFQFDPKCHTKLKNKDEQTIYSARPYLTALRALERDLEQSTTPVFNLYGGGAVIKGTTPVAWEEVLSKGILESAPGSLERLLHILTQGRSPVAWPVLKSRGSQWANSLRATRKGLEKLFKKPGRNRKEIHTALDQILLFVQQDPLYRPYLVNEIINLAGLTYAKGSYGLKDLAKCKQILRIVLSKVKEIERCLLPCTGSS